MDQGEWQFPTPFERNEIDALYTVKTGFVTGQACDALPAGEGRVKKILLMLTQNKVYQVEMWKAGYFWREQPDIPNPLYLRTPDCITAAMQRKEFCDVFGTERGAWRVVNYQDGQIMRSMPDMAEQQRLLDSVA